MDTQYVDWFRSTSPYINSNRDKVFVLALRGSVVAHANAAKLIEDIILLHSLGVRLVVCLGAELQFHASRGLAADKPIDSALNSQDISEIAGQLGALRYEFEIALSRTSRSTPERSQISRIVSGNFVSAKPMGVVNGVDMEHLGAVRKIDHQGISNQLAAGNIVLLTALAGSPSGEQFALNTHELSRVTAAALNADKLILFSENDGLLSEGTLLRELSLSQAVELKNAHTQDPWKILETAIEACSSNVARTQVVSYTNSAALLTELFSRDGSGTLISPELFETVRQATIDDINAILELIEPLERDGTLVRRNREKLEAELDRFTVIERDGAVIASAALYPLEDSHSGELACVVTHPDYQAAGRAAKLLKHIKRLARAQEMDQLFVLTTKTAHWFLENGFQSVDKEDLPEQRQALYNLQRNSRVLRHPL